ncbi:hypothetical protein AGOR_G00232600 [Albula goreensis]|uniref:DUF3719 domain-containing protein n=1 Tax=Albula goreensis TaxID=1534307 RepID=A0A8T3CG25_9TELE|nr:hypothetical protein AGOR_G00232600 [Albula goreensis]
MHGALASLAWPPALPQLHQSCARHCRAGRAKRDWELIVIGKKLNKQSPGHGFSDKNAYPIPAHFTTSVVGASESYQSVSPQSPDSQPSDGRVTPLSHLISWSETQSCATEISTEQSSICSWRDDEFDRVNTQRVCQLFADVDELLYEGKLSSRTQALLDECRQWNGQSPHLRILGKQLEAPKHEGFQFFHRMATCTSDGNALAAPPQDSASDSREFCVEGYKVVPTPCVLHSSSSIQNTLSVHHLTSILEEEVYEAEGQIWEFFAYDAKEADEEGVDYRKALAPVRSGVPPVSPHACIRDAVAGEVFDNVWRQVVSVLEAELLHKHWENDLTDAVAHVGASDSNRAACDSSAHILIKSLTGPTSRGSDTRSMSLWPNIIPRQVSQVSSASKNNLNGVMTIQAKPLQQRQHGFSEKTQCDADDRPGPLMLAGKGPAGLMEHSFLSASRGSCALSRRPPSQRRLPKLSADTRPSPGHAVNNSNGILRGTKLSTVTEGMASAPVSAARKQRFPSIRPDALDQEPASGPASRLIPHRGRVPQSRVVSAIHPVSTLPPLQEPTLQLDALPRPNTTHTFRSDTPIKRSFTPMEFACHMRSGRRPVTGERSRIGVTGFSMGISNSTANSFAEGTSPQRRALHPPSTEGEEAEGPLPLGTHHQRKAFSRIPAHGKKKLQAALS